MFKNVTNLKFAMEELIATEIRRLVAQADVYVFALYDPRDSDSGPVDFRCYQREKAKDRIVVDVRFDFEGVGVWYICRRLDDTFKVRHILAHIKDGKFRTGKVAVSKDIGTSFLILSPRIDGPGTTAARPPELLRKPHRSQRLEYQIL